jgi:TIR domain
MPRIFLSYRRQDSAGVAGRIYDRLRAHFGDDAVFMDIDAVPFGVDFREHISMPVGQCDIVLAVVGTKWAGKTKTGRRIEDPPTARGQGSAQHHE